MEFSRRQLLSLLALAPLVPVRFKGWLASLEPTQFILAFKHPPGAGEITVDIKHGKVTGARWTVTAADAKWHLTQTRHMAPASAPDPGGWQTWIHADRQWLVQMRCRALPDADEPTLDIDWLAMVETAEPKDSARTLLVV
jgi:hypothetical protein